MQAVRLTFFRVARQMTPSPPALQADPAEISDFLVDHVQELRKRANDGTAANATFGGDAARRTIETLCTGDDASFLDVAGDLGKRLVAEMNATGNAKSGLLVCVTFHDESTPPEATAAVLKLEVVAPNGAVLEKLESGEESLAAVVNVLDKPGELQKGLVFPDERSASDAVVGDNAALEARYFLRAVGVALEEHDANSARALVRAFDKSDAGAGIIRQVVEALPNVEAGGAEGVLAGIRERVPSVTQDLAADVLRRLESAERPVRRVDTAAPLKATLRAGLINVSGPAVTITQITWEPDLQGGGWTVSFHVDSEPKIEYK